MNTSSSDKCNKWRCWLVFATNWFRLMILRKKNEILIKLHVSTKRVKEGVAKLAVRFKRICDRLKAFLWWLL